MPTTTPDWQHLALYALGAAFVLILLQRIPYVGRAIRFVLSLGLLAFFIFLLLQQAPYEPGLGRLVERLGLDRQEVVGNEVRIRMSPDGHFWANVTMNGIPRRMLIDSGATVTSLSEATAAAASVQSSDTILPVVMRTANGMVPARTGTVKRLRLGAIAADHLKVVVSPALDIDILGMNFLSQLKSWRVEGRTLVLVPEHAGSEG